MRLLFHQSTAEHVFLVVNEGKRHMMGVMACDAMAIVRGGCRKTG